MYLLGNGPWLDLFLVAEEVASAAGRGWLDTFLAREEPATKAGKEEPDQGRGLLAADSIETVHPTSPKSPPVGRTDMPVEEKPLAALGPMLALRGWAKICVAVGVPNTRSEQRALKKMNDLTDGPIVWVGRRPEVGEIELREWIEDRHERARRLEMARDSDRAAARELEERGGIRQQDYRFHQEKRPNARGKARPAPDD